MTSSERVFRDEAWKNERVISVLRATIWMAIGLVILITQTQRLGHVNPMGVLSVAWGALSLVSTWLLLRAGSHLHPAVGLLFAMVVVNLYWAVSGWLKAAYATCFYLWACECVRRQSTDRALAPLPLRHALDAA
jgi:hypothetical protein